MSVRKKEFKCDIRDASFSEKNATVVGQALQEAHTYLNRHVLNVAFVNFMNLNICDASCTQIWLKYVYDDVRICGAVLISNPLLYRRSWQKEMIQTKHYKI